LPESHAQELIPTGKAADAAVALVTLDMSSELAKRNEIGQLRENGSASVHAPAHCRRRGGKAKSWHLRQIDNTPECADQLAFFDSQRIKAFPLTGQ
jgi:hypothetical protein